MIGRRSFLLGAAVVSGGAAAARSLVGALEEDPPIINSAVSTTISTHASATPVYSALTHITPDNVVEGELAERIEYSADGLTYSFFLRKDVAWHDDAPFSSADVKFSIENANAKLHPARGAFNALDRVEAPDANTVVLKLKRPSPALIYGTDSYAGSILPKHLWEGTDILRNPLNMKPIGTGPYRFVEYARGDAIRYEKNRNFFKPGKPYFDELIFRIMPDAAGRVAAFQSGDLDLLYHSALPMADAPRLARLPGVSVKQTDLRGAAYLAIFNVRRAPYDDVRVRQAVAHAIDREFIRRNVDTGYTIEMLGPVPPASVMYNRGLVDYRFDPGLANQLLDAAGYGRKDGGVRFGLDLLWPSYDVGVARMGDIIARNLGEIGIKVRLQPLERGALIQKGYVALQFDMLIESYGLGPDPDIGVERLYNSNNIHNPPQPSTNSSGYVNREVDALFEVQRGKVDQGERKVIYDRIQEMIWNDLPVLPMFSYSPPNIFRSSYVTGLFDVSYGNQENFENARGV
jgi:peptide/nickel transport system substrate-binding protein